jgi:hypothetical protein
MNKYFYIFIVLLILFIHFIMVQKVFDQYEYYSSLVDNQKVLIDNQKVLNDKLERLEEEINTFEGEKEKVFISQRTNNTIWGLNFGTMGYFVVTNGRSEEEILRSANHEILHNLINRDRHHYCYEYFDNEDKDC